MKVIKSVKQMRRWSAEQAAAGRSLGLVPTMGFLHEGHLSLIRISRRKTDCTVVSIYVNPTQFAPGEDLDRYPRDFKRDESLCREEGVDVIFYPDNGEMYPAEYGTYVLNEEMGKLLCGRSRPIHFRGVTTIVTKLFNIIRPQVAVFGQKDAQQAIIIKRMVDDLNFDIEILVAPIVREADGLAMSSRNKYLTAEQRRQAVVLNQCLQLAQAEFQKDNHDLSAIRDKIVQMIQNSPAARVDYVEFTDAGTLGLPEAGKKDVLLALAVYFGHTRLIDNTILKAN